MLNKLLKRCMPWMDKGRWYSITIKLIPGTGPLLLVDPVFSNARIENNSVVFNIDSQLTIIDYKFVPNQFWGIKIPPSEYPFSTDDDGIHLRFPHPTGTYWLFMR